MATPEAPLREIFKSISFTQLPLKIHRSFFTLTQIERPQLWIYGRNSKSTDFDVESLRFHALLKFSGYDFETRYSQEPDSSPDGKLPFLLLPDGTSINKEGIIDHLKSIGKEPANSRTDMLAYITLVERNLCPAIEYMIWADRAGFEEVAKKSYLGSYPQAIKYILGWVESTNRSKQIVAGSSNYKVLDGDLVYEDAFRALDVLVEILSDKEFFEDTPGSLDALVFACIHVVMSSPLKSPIRTALTEKSSKYNPLLDYTLNVWNKYFE